MMPGKDTPLGDKGLNPTNNAVTYMMRGAAILQHLNSQGGVRFNNNGVLGREERNNIREKYCTCLWDPHLLHSTLIQNSLLFSSSKPNTS